MSSRLKANSKGTQSHAIQMGPRAVKGDLVTAVMITKNDPAREILIMQSINCFLDQTYKNSELLIVNDGEPFRVQHPRVRELHPQGLKNCSLGALRNFALIEALGQYIIQWDDDDWHDCRRIEVQYRYRSKRACVVLGSQIRVNIQTGEAFRYDDSGGIHGTIFHHKNVQWRYPEIAKGEDTVFLRQFKERLVVKDFPALYVRTFHGANTWNEKHIMVKGSYSRRRPLNKQELVLATQLCKDYAFRACKQEELVNLHLGAGKRILSGWHNHDIDVDLRLPLPWASGSITYILAEHVVEHLTPGEAWQFFCECHRIIKRGGVLRIIVPSVCQILEKADELFVLEMSLLAKVPPTLRDSVWCAMAKWGHQNCWSKDNLHCILETLGFDASTSSCGKSRHEALKGVDQHHLTVGIRVNRVESLVVEAVRK